MSYLGCGYCCSYAIRIIMDPIPFSAMVTDINPRPWAVRAIGSSTNTAVSNSMTSLVRHTNMEKAGPSLLKGRLGHDC